MSGASLKPEITNLPKVVKLKTVDLNRLDILQVKNDEPTTSQTIVEIYLFGYVTKKGWTAQLQKKLGPTEKCSFNSYQMQIETNGIRPNKGTQILIRTHKESAANIKVKNDRNMPVNYRQMTPSTANTVPWWNANVTITEKDVVPQKDNKGYTLSEGEQAALWYGAEELGTKRM
ncbi:MAG: hypothetical protein NWF00_12770 [Candidatus Bathyarchaeota archaeon]|nr:hypothetical protein [Candidatus Bathyarchaeota archaeon]